MIHYQICTRCIMDTSAADISFDAAGVCNYCRQFLERSGHLFAKDPGLRQRELEAFVAKVKASGQGKRYDCIVGVSGGVDSSWALVQVVKLGLRPLAVHMDNGWNSELAQNNIANLVNGLKVDLYTHVIDWNEYRKLMQGFFDSDVIDVELLYDNAMLSVNYQQARKHGIKYILAGTNQMTEGMRMPNGWNWFKFDKKNIKYLGRKFGHVHLETFPSMGTFEYILHEFVLRTSWVSFLDYLDYRKAEALQVLQRDFAYKPYPYKHYESIFTRFYQGYILPRKFGVDKRRVHLATLVASNQMTRAEALQKMEEIPYPSVKDLDEDIAYFLKKMGWNAQQLKDYIARPGKSHLAYPSELKRWEYCVRIYKTYFRRSQLVSSGG